MVCGAWHVPALAERRSLASDRALLKGRPRTKTKVTWAPWTAPRLARASGYNAGAVAPGWFAHLWEIAMPQIATPYGSGGLRAHYGSAATTFRSLR